MSFRNTVVAKQHLLIVSCLPMFVAVFCKCFNEFFVAQEILYKSYFGLIIHLFQHFFYFLYARFGSRRCVLRVKWNCNNFCDTIFFKLCKNTFYGGVLVTHC